MLNSKYYNVMVNKKIVDVIYLNINILFIYKFSFICDDDVVFMLVNIVVENIEGFDNYVVVGGGKMGIDICLWLFENYVVLYNIYWVVLWDVWLLNWKNM